MNPVPTIARRTRRSLRVSAAAAVVQGGQAGTQTALAALVAALVLGILGMHALASHGTPATIDASPGMTTTTSVAGLMAGGAADRSSESWQAGAAHADDSAMQTHASGELGSQAAGHGAAEGSGHGSGDAMSMLMLCAVMLAAAALTLLVLLVLGVLRPLLPAAFSPAGVHAQARQWVRGTSPPYEWQFSVIRC